MAIQAEYATQSHLIPQAASIVGLAGAIFINSLDHDLSTLPSSIALTPDQMAHIRDSVQYVWAEEMSQALTNEQRTQIVEIFVDSCAFGAELEREEEGTRNLVLAGSSATRQELSGRGELWWREVAGPLKPTG
ncbi:6263_t:CDS:2 [Acaulospora colombiana]|uniref:6263_t:CDS:1 n=1 Tax=Acaulospora colombiana TaxID=27376 RepID=A0ACA9NY41_9GLOM|nr:6263_t:CDS:2 [Acaulospora colombiana]